MNNSVIQDAIKKVRETSSKKKFSQTFDLVINFKEINLKNPEEKVDVFVALPKGFGKEKKVCAFVDNAMYTEAKTIFDKVILKDDFKSLSKKDVRKLANEYSFFVAQANIMPDVAGTFGKVLGVRGKMPNPKSGAIMPPKALMKPIYEKFKKTVRLQTKNELSVKCSVGNESMKDEDIAENIETAYNATVHVLPKEAENVKKVLLKLTMGSPVEVKA